MCVCVLVYICVWGVLGYLCVWGALGYICVWGVFLFYFYFLFFHLFIFYFLFENENFQNNVCLKKKTKRVFLGQKMLVLQGSTLRVVWESPCSVPHSFL